MSAHRYQAAWRNIVFNQRFDDTGFVDDPAHLVPAYVNSDYYLESLDPTQVQTLDYRELRQHLEGAEANEAFEGVRVVTGLGRIVASSPADLEDKTWAMYEAFSPASCRLAAATAEPVGLLPFDFKRASASGTMALRFYCRPGAGRPVVVGRVREGLIRPFQFVLVATDPRAYAQAETQAVLGNIVGGANTVTAGGNLYTHPTIEIVLTGAGGSTVTLANVTTGHTFVMNLSGETAGTLILDSRRGSITKAGASKYNVRTSGFLVNQYLMVGDNTITFTGSTNVSSVTFKYRNAYG
jgi:hypothetical protein